MPFDAGRLKALHARLDELERSEAAGSRHRFERWAGMGLLESAAQMDPQRAIDVFVSCVVWDGDGAAVEFAFDGAPTVADGRLAQVQDWWALAATCRAP